MKPGDVLPAARRLYIETTPLIYYVEANPTYVTKMDAILKVVENGPFEVCSAVITLTEVLVHPLREGNAALAQQYRDILVNNSDFELLPITIHIAEAAADLRARYGLRTPDALHIAAAISAGCDTFLTNDSSFKRVAEIGVLVLDELEGELS